MAVSGSFGSVRRATAARTASRSNKRCPPTVLADRAGGEGRAPAGAFDDEVAELLEGGAGRAGREGQELLAGALGPAGHLGVGGLDGRVGAQQSQGLGVVGVAGERA